MAVTINSNLNALRAVRQLDRASSSLSSVQERLASGQRINSASDDAAGLSIASTLNAKDRVYSRGVANVNDALSLINIATGATDALTNILTRLNELAIQSSNGTYTNTQRSALDKEAQALIQEHDRIIKTTSFNGIKIFSEENKSLSIQAGDSAIAVKLSAEQRVGDLTFAAATVYTELTSLVGSTVSGDFNGDGNLDLAGVNFSTDGYANIMLGNGNGTFTRPISYYVGADSGTRGGAYQGTVSITDLNGDGNIDIVFGQTDGFTTLMGNGDGTFYAGVSAIAGLSMIPQGLVVADLNDDGFMDVALGNGAIYNLPTFLGNGDGTFKAVLTNPLGIQSGGGGIAADMNGDGILDIVAAGGSGIRVNLGRGDGTFTNYLATSLGGPFGIGDFNGDGRPDIAVTAGASGYTRILLANGDGTFAAGVTLTHITSATPQTKLTDIDQDGILDIVTADLNAKSLLVYRGNGDGTFEAYRQNVMPTYSMGSGLILEDLNHDGVLDMVSAGVSGTGWYSVLLGNGTVTERSGEQRLLGAQSIDLRNRYTAREALGAIADQFNFISAIRTNLGASESRLHSAANVLSAMLLQYKAAESRIRDTDIADDAAQATSATIRQQAATAVLAQANQQPKLAITLLSSLT